MPSVDFTLGRIAEPQSGVVLRSQALAAGATDDMLRSRIAGGRLAVVRPGVYLLPGFRYNTRSALIVATHALAAVGSHESAAEIHGLVGVRRGLVVVTVAVRSTHRYPDTIVHQSTDLAPAHVIEVDHVRVTTVPRTVIDLAAILNRPRLRSVVEHCVVGRLCDLDQITSMLGTLARRGKPGIRRLRSVIDELGTGVETAASMLERRAVTLLEANGLRPVPQFNLPWRDFRDGRVDLAFPHAKLIIELDGRRWHTRVNDFELDRRRDNLAQLAGWKVLRFTWRDLSDDPAKVVAMVRQALMMTLD